MKERIIQICKNNSNVFKGIEFDIFAEITQWYFYAHESYTDQEIYDRIKETYDQDKQENNLSIYKRI